MDQTKIYDKLKNATKEYDGWLYIGDNSVRYALGQPGRYNLLVVGINPSSATPEKTDPTIRKVRKIVEADQVYDGWIMVNLYPLRNKDPESMPDMPDRELSENNIAVISEVMKRFNIWKIWAAWGNAIDTRDYYAGELEKIAAASDQEWYHLGTMTRWGNPRHPLYMPKDAEFRWFPVADYISQFSDEVLL